MAQNAYSYNKYNSQNEKAQLLLTDSKYYIGYIINTEIDCKSIYQPD